MAKPSHERSRFRERLGTYLMGVAIGCMMVGVLYMSRQMVLKREAALRAAEEPATGPPPAGR